MSFALEMKNELLKYNLLNHPFYQKWNEGTLSLETLQKYVKQYKFQVENLTSYIKATKEITNDYASVKILNENILDEEENGKPHTQLWSEFSQSLGVSQQDLDEEKMTTSMENLISTCKKYASKSSASGFGVLYAQEHNYANIATSKKEGLIKHFNKTTKDVEFFTVHEVADVWHEEQIRTLLDALPTENQEDAKISGISVMKALNGFLDEMLALEGDATCNMN